MNLLVNRGFGSCLSNCFSNAAMSCGWQLVRSTILSHGWLNVLSSSCENIYIIISKLDVLFCHKLDSMFCLVPMKIFK